MNSILGFSFDGNGFWASSNTISKFSLDFLRGELDYGIYSIYESAGLSYSSMTFCNYSFASYIFGVNPVPEFKLTFLVEL